MAILSPPYLLGAAGQVLSGRLGRLALGAAFLPASTGVLSVSGVLHGPPNTMGELSLAAGNITVKPFRAVVQCSLDASAGQYIVVNDADAVFATTAQHATQFRKGLVVIDVDDSQVNGVASSATTDRARLYLLDGALAATSGAAALPALPDSSLALGEYLIPPTGQTITITPYNPRTTTRGGILPVLATDVSAPLFDGQFRSHPTRGLQRGSLSPLAWNQVDPDGQPFVRATSSQTVPPNTLWGVGQLAISSEVGGWTAPSVDILRVPAGAGGLFHVAWSLLHANAMTGARNFLDIRSVSGGSGAGPNFHRLTFSGVGESYGTGHALIAVADGTDIIFQPYMTAASGVATSWITLTRLRNTI